MSTDFLVERHSFRDRFGDLSASIYSSVLFRLAVRRLLQAIPVLLGVTFIVFTLLSILPGGTVRAILGLSATPENVRELTIKLGLNHPFIERYFNWLGAAVHGDFGKSLISGLPVSSIMGQRIPVSAELGGLAFLESLVAGVVVSILIAHKPNGVVDRAVLLISVFGFACPPFVLALLAIIVFSVHLHLLPAFGFVPLSKGVWPNLRSLILPSMAIAFGIFCAYVRILRGDILDQINGADYVVTAQAKGVSPWVVLTRHALRNSLFNLITVAVLNFGAIVGGTVLIEQIFNIPGMGQLLFQSIQSRDVTTVQAVVVVVSCAVVVANLIADILYTVLDPRVRFGREPA